jgi:hypothetical protein
MYWLESGGRADFFPKIAARYSAACFRAAANRLRKLPGW